MFKTSKNVHILVGVVSFGPQGCGDSTLPNVFARVTEVLSPVHVLLSRFYLDFILILS